MIKNFSFSVDLKGLLKSIEEAQEWAQQETAKLIKQEINHTLQVANRRLQNIEKSGVTSTAYKALVNELPQGRKSKFSKLSIGGLDLTNPIERVKAVDTYSRALAFLNNTTSTVRGARQFISNLAQQNNVDFGFVNNLVDMITEPKMTNGQIIINNWDSERIRNMTSEYLSSYGTQIQNSEDYQRNIDEQIQNALNATKIDRYNTWDL